MCQVNLILIRVTIILGYLYSKYNIKYKFLLGMRVPYNDRAKLLIEDNLPSKDPIIWFEQWFNEAKNNPEVVEPNAMCLATATKYETRIFLFLCLI